jgi:Predicted nucleotide-binding protein containing TIR-like domain
MQLGRRFLDSPIGGVFEVEQMERAVRQWGDENQNLLTRLFDTTEAADHYAERRPRLATGSSIGFRERISNVARSLVLELSALESRFDSLGLIHEVEGDSTSGRASLQAVFLVHGHDDAALHEVARFLASVGLEPRILRELPNRGRTIIEKFEDYATTTYAVVLLTPDDACDSANGGATKRPRQNVVLELGYFLGRLGRERVCALYKEGTEIPSDYTGVLFIPFDGRGGWQWTLAKELKAAQLKVDIDRAMG